MLNLLLHVIILGFATLIFINLLRIQYNILMLFLYFEVFYVASLALLNSLAITYQIPNFSVFFIYLIAVSSMKSIIGLCIVINYIRVNNSIYL